MNIKLIVPNYMRSKTFLQPPVELYTISKLLKKLGHSVDVIDCRVLNKSSFEISSDISVNKTELIIFSTSPYDMSQMYHMDYRYRYAEHFIKYIKSTHPDIKMFAIGAQPTLKPENFLNHTKIDGVVLWEAERTVVELIEKIEDGQITSVPNLVLYKDDKILFTKYDEDYAHPASEFFDVVPEWDMLDLSNYFGYDLGKTKHERVNNWGVILGSRGCMYQCDFCFNFYKNNSRYRQPNIIAQEMQLLKVSGAKRVFFLDMTFTQNRDWAISVCNALIGSKNDLLWICQTRCDCVDYELLSLMKKAGCCGVEFGVETYNNDSLNRLNKNVSTAEIDDAIANCKNLNIQVKE